MSEAQMPLLSQTLDGDKSYEQETIPSFADLKELYGIKWQKEKDNFQTQLKCNFFALV